jgi:predicted acyltransferase
MTDSEQPVATPVSSSTNERLTSLDALRGFDMFWIVGGEGIAHAAAKLTGWAWLVWLSGQLEHPEWHGFAFYDLIFPLFLFLAGVSMPFSFEKRTARGDTKSQLVRHVIIRGLVLVLLGMVFNGLLKFNWPDTRLPSVLGRIGLAYLFAGLIVLNTKPRVQLLAAIGLLILYWAALKFIPVPGFGAGDLSPGHTLTDWIDRSVIPGRLHRGDRDPEGILGVVPAIATCLAGVLTGHLLKSSRVGGLAKTGTMIFAGVICLGLGWLWNGDIEHITWWSFPINKNLWSSSFVLWCAGLSLLFLSLFYLVIDVWKFRRWAILFTVIGANSIFIYMTATGRIIDYANTADYFFGGALQHTGSYQPLLSVVSVVLIEWLLLYFMYRKKMFLRV